MKSAAYETIDLWLSEITQDVPPASTPLRAEYRMERWPLQGRPTRFPPPLDRADERAPHPTDRSLFERLLGTI